jgi:pimeloyl-ACP methyl ester carboxylesterase
MPNAVALPSIQRLNIQGVEVQIEGQGTETLLMLHGWPDTLALWNDTVQTLRTTHRCVRFTLPAFDANAPLPPKSLIEMVAFIDEVVQQVSPDQPITLVLHDWGCIFGYEYAAVHPHRVGRMVAVDVGDHNSRALFASWSAKAKWGVFSYQIWLAIAWQWVNVFGNIARPLANRMTRYMAKALRCPSAMADMHVGMNVPYAMKWMGTLEGFDLACNVLKILPTARPMLYIYGKRKPFMFHSDRWLEKIAAHPGSRVEGFDTGHWVMSNKPEQFNALLKEWLV